MSIKVMRLVRIFGNKTEQLKNMKSVTENIQNESPVTVHWACVCMFVNRITKMANFDNSKWMVDSRP